MQIPMVVLKRRSIVVMIVFTIVSFGLYFPLWFLRRLSALNQLDAPRKLQQWPFVAFLVFAAIRLIVLIASGSQPPAQTMGAPAALVLSLGNLAFGLLMVVQCFKTKDILETHLAEPAESALSRIIHPSVKLSGLVTFFFSIFYLQHAINRYILTPAISSPGL